MTFFSAEGKKERRSKADFAPTWSEWRDLNSRPLDPQSSALPTAPHPESAARSQLNYNSTLFLEMQPLN